MQTKPQYLLKKRKKWRTKIKITQWSSFQKLSTYTSKKENAPKTFLSSKSKKSIWINPYWWEKSKIYYGVSQKIKIRLLLKMLWERASRTGTFWTNSRKLHMRKFLHLWSKEGRCLSRRRNRSWMELKWYWRMGGLCKQRNAFSSLIPSDLNKKLCCRWI